MTGPKPKPEDDLHDVPDQVSTGSIVVHNHVKPAQRLGTRGFRAWVGPEGTIGYVPCDCGWMPHLGTHYRVDRKP